jgi:hypothetical protein
VVVLLIVESRVAAVFILLLKPVALQEEGHVFLLLLLKSVALQVEGQVFLLLLLTLQQ